MDTSKNNLQLGLDNKAILKMTLPIALAIIVPQLNFIINNIFLGALSRQALALAGITGVYYLIFAVIGNGLNNGLQSMIARKAGENNTVEIGKLFFQGIRIALIMSVAGMLLTWFLAPTILSWSMRDQTLSQEAVAFLNIRIIGLPFLYLYQMRNALLVGINQSKLLIVGTATETIINILLDYALIFGHFGLPEMGFTGAAIASVIAEASGLLVIFFVIKYKGFNKTFQLFKHTKYSADYTKQILVRSAPLIGQYAISIISWEFFYVLIEHHGERDLAISNAMRNIFGLFGCFTWAFASASNAMVSNIIGQGLQDRVLELINRIMKLSIGFSIVVCVLLNLFPQMFLSVYSQGDGFIQAAIPVLRVVSIAMVLMPAGTVWLNAVVGTGNTKINLYTEAMAIVIYCTYNYFVLEHLQLPIVWGWASEWLYWITMFLPSYWYMKSGRWKNSLHNS